jgi:hypothetical protein
MNWDLITHRSRLTVSQVWTTIVVLHLSRYKKKMKNRTDTPTLLHTHISTLSPYYLDTNLWRAPHLLQCTLCVFYKVLGTIYSPNGSVAVGGVLVGERELEWRARRCSRISRWAGPMIHRLWTWTTLITDPWSVARLFLARIFLIHRFIGANVPRGAVGPIQWSCDASTVLWDVQDHSLMVVVAVKCGPLIQVLPTLAFWSTDLKSTLLVHWWLVHGIGSDMDPRGGFWVVRPDLVRAVGPTFPTRKTPTSDAKMVVSPHKPCLMTPVVDGAKPCSSSPQAYGWLGAFFTKEGSP